MAPTRRTRCRRTSTESVLARIGSTPTRPSAPSTTAPTTRPPAASVSGGRPVLSSPEIRKYVAAPTIAPSAHSTPAMLRSAPEMRSSTRTRPNAATAAPASVIGPGRWPCTSHSHTTTAAGAVNSMRMAGPTCMYWTAEK